MSLHIIIGSADTDKTTYCFDIMETASENGVKNCMIVPDQFSYEAERMAIKRFGGITENRYEIITFNKIIRKVREYLALPDYMTASGREMVVCRAIEEAVEDGSVFAGSRDKKGFVGVMSELISEMKRYKIEPSDLEESIQTASNEMLKNKLQSICAVYSRYEELTEGKFSDSMNDLNMTADFIREGNMFTETVVCFDGFSDFLPQNMCVVEEIIKAADDVYVTLTIPEEGGDTAFDDKFDVCRRTLSQLKRIASENNIKYEVLTSPHERKRNEEVRFFAEAYNRYGMVYEKETENISLFYAQNPYSETEYAASMILNLVRSKGLRFKDISVLCTDTSTYMPIIRSVFAGSKIPYFTDETIPVTDHPVIAAIDAVFAIIKNDWRYEDVFTYLKSGFVHVRQKKSDKKNPYYYPQSSIDELENYVIKYGIRGRRRWYSKKPWERSIGGIFGGRKNDESVWFNDIRIQIAEPIKKLEEKLKNSNAQEAAEAFFRFLEDINMAKAIEKEINLLRRDGYMNEASQLQRVWGLLMEVLDQVCVTMADKQIGADELGRFISAGLSRCEIRIIPSSLDHVAAGTIDRSRSSDVKHLFILGANFGKIPPDTSREGILSDKDRKEIDEKLADKGLFVAPDTRGRAIAEKNKIYRSLCSARDAIHISYSAADIENNALRPAQFVIDMMKTFPKMNISDDFMLSSDNLQTPQGILNAFLHHFLDSGMWQSIKEELESKEEFKEMLEHVSKIMLDNAVHEISAENAQKLFGGEKSKSISQLEKYNSCPYSYFLGYGLGIHERTERKIDMRDLGTFAHMIIENYCNKVTGENKTYDEIIAGWKSRSDEDLKKIADDIFNDAMTEFAEDDVYSKGHIDSVSNKIRKAVYSAVRMINASLQSGIYAFAGSEVRFDGMLNNKVHLAGIIDRIDTAEVCAPDGEKTSYIRIIDYKTGKNGTFSMKKLAAGTSIQLMTYAIIASLMCKNGELPICPEGCDDVRIGGVFYNRVHDDIFVKDTPEEAQKEYDKDTKLNGVIFTSNEAMGVEEVKYMDGNIDETDKSRLASEFLPVKINSGDKQISKTSSVCTNQDGMVDNMVKYTVGIIEDTYDKILSGEFDANPCRIDNRLPCEYCEYADICRYDNKNDRVVDITKDEFAQVFEEGGKQRELEYKSTKSDNNVQ